MVSFQRITLSFLLVSGALFAYLIPLRKTYVCDACDRIRDADRHHRQDTGSHEYEHDAALCEDFGGEYQPRDEKNRRDAVIVT